MYQVAVAAKTAFVLPVAGLSVAGPARTHIEV